MTIGTTPVISVATGLPRPTWRGRLHTWAFTLSIPAALILVLVSRGIVDRLAATVYGFSLVAVFGVSAAYHRLARSPLAQQRMQRVDHSTIYLQIAGTYTPVCLLALPPEWGRPALLIVWTLAALGVALKIAGSPRLVRASNGFYPVLGWAAMVMAPVLVRSLSALELGLLLLGGALYSIGAIVFYRRRPDPSPLVFGYHEVWHACTVAAGASHFVMVASVTIG